MDDIYRTNINGVDISLKTTESTEYTDAVVEDLRHRIRNVMQEGHVSVHKAAILAGLTLCDELAKAQAENDRLRREMERVRRY